jgi:hypothetical protein
MNKFEFNTEENDSQVKLYCRELIYGGSTVDKTYIQFDKRSLPELIKVLEQGDCINLLAEPTIKTDWDKINIYILGDERSSEGFILELFNDREFISGDENDCFGPVTIPLGQKPEETGWEYIRPLIEDLKKYC